MILIIIFLIYFQIKIILKNNCYYNTKHGIPLALFVSSLYSNLKNYNKSAMIERKRKNVKTVVDGFSRCEVKAWLFEDEPTFA